MNILITGTTGFVGSAIAAQLLSAGHNVVTLDRKNPTGARARFAINAAQAGLNLTQHGTLSTYEWQPQDIEQLRPTLQRIADEIGGIQTVIHAAAEMSYNPAHILSSLTYNQTLSLSLYETVTAVFRDCQRYYYISTAYSGGPHADTVSEKLCAKPQNVNAYQFSKWATEQSLFVHHLNLGLPVSLLRPSIVIGAQTTGWGPNQAFGFYMFLDGMLKHKKAGYSKACIDLNPANHIHLLPINIFTAAVQTLLSQDQKAFEVFNCVPAASSSLLTSSILEQIQKKIGLELVCNSLLDSHDMKLDRMVQPNKLFANHPWKFESTNLNKYVHCWPPVVQEGDIQNVISHYANSKLEVKRDKEALSVTENIYA